MKNMKKFAALALCAVMAASMAAPVYADGEIKTKDDLAGKVIGVQQGTTGDLEASKEEYGAKEVKRFNKGSEAIMALLDGKIDCVIIDSQPAQKFVENNEGLKILEEEFVQEEYAICLQKGSDKLDAINEALAELKEEGIVDSIMSNYIGDEIGQTPYESPEDVDRSNGKLVMATNATFPPYEYKDGDDFAGIDVEIAGKIAEKLGLKLEIQDVEFGSIIGGVQTGKFDMGMAGMTVTDERKQSVNFTNTYAKAKQVVIVKEGSAIKSLDDLKGDSSMKYGVQQDTTGDIYASDTAENGGYGEENVIRYKTGAEAIEALKADKVQAVIIDNEPAKSFVEANEGLTILDGAWVEEEYAIAISKDNEELLNKINAALEELKADGTIQQIVDKYIPAK